VEQHYPLFYTFNFYLFGVIAIASALVFVTRKSPVAAALWLVNTMFSLSALFVMLDAQFIGVMQVLVYAGAIMVVFLFVVMLLNLGHASDVTDIRGLGGRLTAESLAAGEVSVVFEIEEAEAISVSVVPAAPSGNVGELWTAALGLLGELKPQAPVAAVRVGVTRLTPASGRQADLLRPGDGAHDAVVATADRLRSRFGAATVRRPRLALDPGDLPERRFTWEAPVVAGAAR